MSKSRSKPRRPEIPDATPARFLTPRRACVVALLLGAAAYANGVTGELVWDDGRQIAENHLIQDSTLYYRALTSDVWSFTDSPDRPRSNYWRPVFIAWLIANYRLFGLHPVGWHVTNVVLHLGVTLLGFAVARRLGAGVAVSAAATWLFAVHPVHVESVTWISGSPDLLMAGFLLGGLLLFLRSRSPVRPIGLAASVIAFVAAILAKEVAMVLPGITAIAEWRLATAEGRRPPAALGRAAAMAAPYLAGLGIYLAVRAALGQAFGEATPNAPTVLEAVLTAPRLMIFYLRQSLLPIWLSPLHGIRAVRLEGTWILGVVPYAIGLAAIAWYAWRVWRRSTLGALAVAIFALGLLPAFNIRVFQPEELVHDRYLYLPLLGFLLVLTDQLQRWITRARGTTAAERAVPLIAAAFSLVLGVFTARYNLAFRSNMELWRWAADTYPEAVEPNARVANLLRTSGRFDEALRYYERSLAGEPGHVASLLGVGNIAMQSGDFATAERYIKAVIEAAPDHEAAIDQLGLCYQSAGRAAEAIAVFEEAQRRLPHLRFKYTFNIAMVAGPAKMHDRALAELESISAAARDYPDRYYRRVWYLLGELYEAIQRPADARRAYATYLQVSDDRDSPDAPAMRTKAAQALERLPR
ncbi:MAG: tetratricopeptide repeat protein [Phycisphaerae bacterium]|nr:tetratricopeptide repeat protein [Phycisphaerae bacterium]